MELEEILKSDDTFRYMMLDRLRSDSWYYIKTSHHLKSLYFHDTKKHVDAMKAIWNSLPVKPEWLTMEDITEIEDKMKEIQ